MVDPRHSPLLLGPTWPDLVFHVLAHVSVPAFPANLFSAEYTRYVAAAAGPVAARPLGEGAAALAASVHTHAEWARLQHVAWLFSDLEQARTAALTDLSELSRELTPVLPAAELLRASALLEAEVHAALPTLAWDRAALSLELARASSCAPRLASAAVHVAPALTHHGRVVGARIWIGAPAEQLAVSVEHAALQAAHEATVLEVSEAVAQRGLQMPEREREAVAVVVFAERAAAQHRAEAHAVWGARWQLTPEHFASDRLAPASLELTRALLRR